MKQRNGKRGHFWGGVPDISQKNKDARETVVFWVYVWPFWGSAGALRWLRMVDTPIPDRFEIGSSKEMVRGVILGVEILILYTI